MAKKVAVCAGHGGNNSTPGKRTPDGEYEWNFNDKVIRAGIALLEANGVEVLRTDDASGKTDVPLNTRTQKANDWGADVYWSSHHNALTGKWIDGGLGIETYTQNGNRKEAERLASIVHPKYVKAMGLRDRGLKKANFAITRQTKMPAILTEGGFMDSKVDIVAMRDEKKLKAQGEAIAEGILEYLGIKKTANAPTETTKPAKKPAKKPATKSKWTQVTGNWTGQTLRNWQYGNPVLQLQTKLANNKPPFYPEKGAKNNGVDSYYGDKTKDAVTRFQTYHGLTVDGLAGKQVYGQLNGKSKKPSKSAPKQKAKAKYPLPTGVYSRAGHGSRSLNAVRKIQTALNAANFKVGKVDGYYGQKTEDAVRRFQSMYVNGDNDGIYGKLTRTALNKKVN